MANRLKIWWRFMRTGDFAPHIAWQTSKHFMKPPQNRPAYIYVDGVPHKAVYGIANEMSMRRKRHMRAIRHAFEWLCK